MKEQEYQKTTPSSSPNTESGQSWVDKRWVVSGAALFLLWETFSQAFIFTHPLRAADLTPPAIAGAVNRERDIRHIVTLRTDDRLARAAQYKSDDMQARRYFDHVDPDGHYIWNRIVAEGYTPYIQLGENLAVEFYSVDSLVSAWMNSPTHRDNLLQEGFRDQGVGLAFGKPQDGQFYSAVANTFGRLQQKKTEAPAAAAPQPKAAPPPAKGSPSAASPEPRATGTPAAASSPPNTVPGSAQKPLALRGDGSDVPSFTTSNVSSASAPPATAAGAGSASPSAAAVNGAEDSAAVKVMKFNRYASIAVGLLLLLLIVADLRDMLAKGVKPLDKKFGNLMLLALALAVVAFLYWF